jgi:hypothetical protein
MFDIVAPHQNELPLPVEIEGIDNSKAGLTCPAAAWHMKPTPKCKTKDEQNQ